MLVVHFDIFVYLQNSSTAQRKKLIIFAIESKKGQKFNGTWQQPNNISKFTDKKAKFL